jgi:hypothetical protein
MNLFLSYASENTESAEAIYLALVGAGYQVFMDKSELNPSDNYDLKLRTAVDNADGFVFLISPHAVAAGSYALTELKYARQKWPHPQQRVLPVMVQPTDYNTIPIYLKAVTILEPEGNIAAEVSDAVNKLFPRQPDDTKVTNGADISSELWQKYGSLVMVILCTIILAVILGTWFVFSYPRVAINLNLGSLFVVAGLLMVLAIRWCWIQIQKIRK